MLPHWTQGDVTVNDARMHYYRAGTTGKTPLVLAHGFSDNGLCWQQVTCDLEAHFDVIMPDSRGHGLSARVAKGEHTDRVSDLAEIMRALRIERAVVAGHSMGGTVAGQFGARFPELTRALVLEDPAWFMPAPQKEGARVLDENGPFYQWLKDLEHMTLDEAVARTHAEHPTWSDAVARHWTEGKMQLDLNFFSTEDASWGGWQEVVQAITCPTLLLTADVDKGGIVTPELAAAAVELNPLIQPAHIPGTGHHVRFENYPAYIEVVKAFLMPFAQPETA